MLKKVGHEDLANIARWQSMIYIAGQKDHHVEAKVTVVFDPSMTSAQVRIDEITVKGDAVDLRVGQVIIAGANELYYEVAD